jgi:hypothetical protein
MKDEVKQQLQIQANDNLKLRSEVEKLENQIHLAKEKIHKM